MSIPHAASPPALESPSWLTAMAERIVDACAGDLPDLRGIRVLVPHARLIAPVKVALANAAAARGFAVILPPQCRTWRGWAEELIATHVAAGGIAPMMPLARLAYVARHLQRAGLLPGDAATQAKSSWRLARGVLRLVDGLTEAAWARGRQLHEAANLEDFLARLTHAYGSANRVAERQLAAESQLVFSVWQALIADADAPDPVALRLRVVEEMTARASAPLFVLTHAPETLEPVESRLIALYEQAAPVQVIGPPSDKTRSAWLDAAWQGGVAPRAGLSGISILAARSLEAEARAGVQQIHAWLGADMRHIAIVALDRAAARRLRALLERDQLLLEDEGGWRLSTTSAAAAVMRLIDLAHVGAARADYREVFDLLKSPLVFADLPLPQKRTALKVIERAIGQAQAATGLTAMREAVRRVGNAGEMPEEAHPERLLGKLHAVLDQFGVLARRARASTTLRDWFAQAQSAFAALGMQAALQADIAGQQVLTALDQAAAEVANVTGEAATQPLAVWRDLLAELFETTEFRDTSITSTIKLTQLAAMPLRQFEAVLVLGADGAHLLPPPPDLPLVKSSVRHDFGLRGVDEARTEVRAALKSIVATARAVTFTWQAQRGKRPVPLAAELELLERVHQQHTGESLLRSVDFGSSQTGHSRTPLAAPSAAALVPQRISVSAYASLIACPYQFFARNLLGLGAEEEIRLTADQRDIGLLLHRVLNALHAEVPRFSAFGLEALQARFTALARAESARLVGAQYVALGWLARFGAAFPTYVAWQIGREAQGWAFHQGEIKAERRFDVGEAAAGQHVQLYGRLDRIDTRSANGNTEVAVLDYKTQGRASLNARTKHAGEDTQLAAYVLLQSATAPVAQALYVPLKPDKHGALDEPTALADELLDGMAEEARLVSLFKHLHRGAALPANAAAKVCITCEMRGLCRRSTALEPEGDEATV